MRMVGLLALVGCESNDMVVAEMERAISASNVGIASALVASELLGHTHDVPDTFLRHPTGSQYGCPGVLDFQGTTDNFSVTLDYATNGCIPDTGLVPTVVSGHAGLHYAGGETSATFDQLFVDLDNAVSGTLGGAVSQVDTTVTADPSGTLTVGPSTVDLDLHVVIDSEGITLDGDATVVDDEDDPVSFDGVFILRTDIVPPCATPSVGDATLTGGKKDVIVHFAEPGSGFVTAERGNDVSEQVDLCALAYRSEIF
jgi:hypothetical protein